MRIRIALAALVAAASFAAASPTLAGENVFRFGVAYVEPAGAELIQTVTPGNPPPLSTEIVAVTEMDVDGNASFNLGFERRFSDGLGLELNVNRIETRVQLQRSAFERETENRGGAFVGTLPTTQSLGDATITPITLGLNVYLDNRENIDVSLGPVLGITLYDDVRIPVEGGTLTKATEPAVDVEIGSDFSFGVMFAIGTRVSERWEFRGAARWLKSTADFLYEQRGETVDLELDVDPLSYEFAFGVRF